MKACLTSLLVYAFFLTLQPVQAEDLDEVIHAMREGNFAEAYCILRPYADAGDADAQYNIGWMYLNGYGLAINDSLALEWWQRAADQGHTDASFSIAMLYNLGEGQVEKDMGKAIDYYLLAAEDGHEDALLILKSMLQRDDRALGDRRLPIINTYGHLLGSPKQVKSKRVNVRSGPGTGHAIIASLERGSVVLALDTKGNWTSVVLKNTGKSAWIYTSLLEDHVADATIAAEAGVEEAEQSVEEAEPDSTEESGAEDFE